MVRYFPPLMCLVGVEAALAAQEFDSVISFVGDARLQTLLSAVTSNVAVWVLRSDLGNLQADVAHLVAGNLSKWSKSFPRGLP